MAFVPGEHTARVVILSGDSTLQWTNSLWFVRANFTQTHLEELTQAVVDAWALAASSFLADNYGTRGGTGYDMRSSDAPTFEYNITPDMGERTGQVLPIQDALVITMYTSARGRSGRGRVYLCGTTEDTVTDGVFTSTYMTDGVGIVTAAKDAAFAVGWNLVISSTQQDGVPLTSRMNRVVTSIVCRSGIPGNQQRRSRRP